MKLTISAVLYLVVYSIIGGYYQISPINVRWEQGPLLLTQSGRGIDGIKSHACS
jgi:hypothetical protein